MKMTAMKTIEYYKEYLGKKKIDISEINKNIKNLENIKFYEADAKLKLENLENLSKEYKLYDSDYNGFMIAMGKLSIGLNKMKDLNISDENIKILINRFLNFHQRFETLEQSNIMKDVYIWKYLNN